MPAVLHKPVLQKAVGALHAALRLARIGAKDLDIEFRQSPNSVMP